MAYKICEALLLFHYDGYSRASDFIWRENIEKNNNNTQKHTHSKIDPLFV